MIVQRYLIREILHYFIAVFSVLLVVAVTVTFVRLLAEMSLSVFSSAFVFQLLILKIIGKLSTLLPASLYVAILLALGRLYSDSEMVAMWSGGIGPRRINLSVFWFLLVFAVLTSVISLYLSPEAMATRDVVWARAKAEAEVSGVLPGRFLEFRNGELVAYAETLSADRRKMENVFAKFTIAGSPNILVAKRARFTGNPEGTGRYIVLEDGYRYSGSPGSVDYTVYRFVEHGFRIDKERPESVNSKANATRTSDLLKGPYLAYSAELQWRISQPISLLLLGMLAVPLARTLPRQGKYTKLAMGIAVYFLYGNAVGLMQTFIERGQVSTTIGIWPVHVAMALVVVSLLYVQSSSRVPMLRKRNRKVQKA
ncbi:MAG: LPS export ABC transporter permease LptF [Gammaproteobacteria bacterium]|nr:MAG: LPS export ABC transporter permease LptF [Gammaproteobacteria bacterium]